MSCLMLVSSDAIQLINYFSQILWLSVAASIAGLLWLRYKRPDAHRPIKVNLAIPIIFLACCLFLTIVPAYTEPVNTGMSNMKLFIKNEYEFSNKKIFLVIGLAITLSGIPVYYITIGWESKPRWISNLRGKPKNNFRPQKAWR